MIAHLIHASHLFIVRATSAAPLIGKIVWSEHPFYPVDGKWHKWEPALFKPVPESRRHKIPQHN